MGPSKEAAPSGDLSLLQRITYSWMYKVVFGARKGNVSYDTLLLPASLQSEPSYAAFSRAWEAKKADKGKDASLIGTLFSVYGRQLFAAGIFKLFWSAFVIMGAFYFTRSILAYVDGVSPYNTTFAGWALTIGYFIDAYLLGASLQRMAYGCMTTGLRVKGALVNAVCSKAFSSSTISKERAADVLAFVASDLNKVYDGMQEIHFLWTSPIEAGVILGLLGLLVGMNALPGVAVVLVVLGSQYLFGYFIIKYKLENAANTQQRSSIVQEVLPAMKLVKYYAWERFFEKEVSECRKRELKIAFKLSIIKTINIAMVFATPPITAFVIFCVYEFTTGRLQSSVAFTTLSMFNIMRFPLVVLPKALRAASEAYAALRRIEGYLHSEEAQTETVPQGAVGARIDRGVFSYPGSNFTLEVPDFSVKPGEVVAVVGRVGAGKSSLLNAILGNMERKQGSIEAGGRISYVPQQAWIQNLTVRENIVFGESFDPSLYASVLHSCALELDMQILTKGDQSMGGLRGVNLSGGQRQRVNLARAAYFQGDLVLLDNAMSAVDHHTAHHIFDNCIKGLFREKAVVLITHQLDFLPRCNKVLIMDEGKSVYFGPWNEQAHVKLSTLLPASHLLHAAGGVEERKEVKPKEAKEAAKVGRDLSLSPTINEKAIKQDQNKDKLPMHIAMRRYWIEGGVILGTVVLLFFLAAQTCRQMSDWWVRQWTNDNFNMYTNNPDFASQYYVILYGALVAVFFGLMLCRGATFYWWATRATQNIHSKMLNRVLNAPLSFFFKTPVGDTLVTFTKDQDIMDESLPDALHYAGIYGLVVLSTTILVSITIPMFSLFVILLLLVTVAMLYTYLPSATILKKLKSESAGAVVTLTAETLDGLNVIQAFNKNQYFIDEAAARTNTKSKAMFNSECLNLWLAFWCDLCGAVMVLGVCLFAILQAKTLGSSAVGLALSNTIQMLVFYTWVVRGLADVISMYSSVEKAGWLALHTPKEGTGEGTELEAEGKKGGKPSQLQITVSTDAWPRRGDIEYSNVYMQYGPGLPWALKGVSFRIQHAESVGVVGRTGSGKSTLLMALYRMFELGKGNINIDGVDVATLTLPKLRRGLSVIPQEPVMWSGTVRSNLDPFGEHQDSELWEVLKQVRLAEQVKAVGGLLGRVDGTGGNAWSLGQQQLVCLSRAALRKVPVLCLDEATAAMDPHTEAEVQALIPEIFVGRTILTIAHRLDTVIQCDKVMVMEQGELMEMDAPHTLLNSRESMFSKLVDKTGPQAAAALRQLASEHFGKVH